MEFIDRGASRKIVRTEFEPENAIANALSAHRHVHAGVRHVAIECFRGSC
jgi:hypothetical protein